MKQNESSEAMLSSNGTLSDNNALTSLQILYGEVDYRASQIAEGHGARLQCRRGCSQCCVDDLAVFEIEAENIRLAHAALLAQQEPHPQGACAFLDTDGACRIYADRPYVCRTQGLPLRWIDEGHNGELVELRDICPLNDEGTPRGATRTESHGRMTPAAPRDPNSWRQRRRPQPLRNSASFATT